MVERGSVYLVNLDAVASSDAKNTRPCVILSPNEVNRNLGTVLAAPISSTRVTLPTRVSINFLNADRLVVLDQIRSVDKGRLVKKIGELSTSEMDAVLKTLAEIFAE